MDKFDLSPNTLSLLSLLITVMPFLAFISAIFSKRGSGRVVSVAAISMSFVLSLVVFCFVWNGAEVHTAVNWFSVGSRDFTVGVYLNNLSVLMMLLVTAIGLIVHVYSIAYMKGDTGIHKYWAYLGLFCFSMLALVISDSLLLIYIFWELVGFSSYLLIGFWFTKDAASRAAKKAFVINRIGDVGFLCGLFIVYAQFGTFDLVRLFGNEGLVNAANISSGVWTGATGQMPAIWVSIAGFAFFAGAMSKSAQFPLHTWLPDAMEGPTSVSSLIHAATMVAAGVFLLGRVYPIFDTLVLNVIIGIGSITAFMAATIALTQNDIKRILAYSTISQLGLMIVGMGIGAYSESLFHLSTHAFFKCLLFLAAGAVIHQLHHYKEHNHLEFDHQDIRLMGGLRKSMPVAFICMCIGAAALAGLPLTSGYLSKDALLITSFEWASGYHGFKKWVPYIMVATSWMTVFYIARMIFKVFFGKPKHEGLHEAPPLMTVPLMILAFCSLFVIFSLNPFSYANSWLTAGFVNSGVQTFEVFHLTVPLVVNVISFALIFLAFKIYAERKIVSFSETGFLYRFSHNGWYLDSVYTTLIVKPLQAFSVFIFKFDKRIVDGIVNLTGILIQFLSDILAWVDRNVVDGVVNGTATVAVGIGNFARRFQSGRLQHYLITMLSVVIAFFLITYFI